MLVPGRESLVAHNRTPDPPFSGCFQFAVDDLVIGRFSEVSGLSVQITVEDLVEGGNNGAVLKLLGGRSYSNIILKRGITNNDALLEWLEECSGEGFEKAGGKVAPRDAHISVLNSRRDRNHPVRTWTISQALPVRWTGPTLAASSSDLATEELEVTHHGFRTR